MSYKVKLEIFEGPLDLLLYLIKKDEINIHDIPIASITEQYLAYLDLMKMLDLNIAGEFLVMAATLMHIKSRMLLPPDELQLSEEEEEDPRQELIRKLLEYKRFKEAASHLQDMEHSQKEVFTRPVEDDIEAQQQDAEGDKYFEASIFDLISAFAKVLKEVPKERFYEVIKDEVTVSEKLHEIFHLLVNNPALSFFSLFSAKGGSASGGKNTLSKIEIIATFLALLELIRMREVTIKQDKPFGDIVIVRNEEKVHLGKIPGDSNVAGEDAAGQ